MELSNCKWSRNGRKRKRSYVIKSKMAQFTRLQDLCRTVIVKSITLQRLPLARKKLPLPRNLLEFVTCSFRMEDFEIQSCNVSRDKRVHSLYPARCLIDKSGVTLKCINLKTCDLKNLVYILESWSRTDHKNISKVLCWFKQSETVAIVFERYSKNLQEVIGGYRKTRQKIPEWFVWKVLFQLCDALLYLQRRGMSHTELHTKNVSVDACGEIRLHNLLMYTPTELELNVCVDMRTSFYGIYVAPERIRGQGHSEKQGVWALGCILYEMVKLEPAFCPRSGGNIFDVLNEIVHGTPPPKLDQTDAYSQSLANLITSCLMPEARLRPALDALCVIAKERVQLTKFCRSSHQRSTI